MAAANGAVRCIEAAIQQLFDAEQNNVAGEQTPWEKAASLAGWGSAAATTCRELMGALQALRASQLPTA
jgi:hypothetical protein